MRTWGWEPEQKGPSEKELRALRIQVFPFGQSFCFIIVRILISVFKCTLLRVNLQKYFVFFPLIIYGVEIHIP